MDGKEHWDQIYGRKSPESVSWYRPHLERSLAAIQNAGLGPGDDIIDIGGGASTLVDDVVRYDAEALHDEFGSRFRKVESSMEHHVTPWGTEQEFVYCLCRIE